MAKTPKKPKVRMDVNTTAFRTLQVALGEAERTADPDRVKTRWPSHWAGAAD